MEKIRIYKKGDGVPCHRIFQYNLEKYYGYLAPPERDAMLAVNMPSSFEEIAKRKSDRLFVIESEGKIVGYFHFGKDGNHLRIKRIQLAKPILSILRDKIFPLAEHYRKKWKCESVMGDAAPHVINRFRRVPGISVENTTKRKVGGKEIEFVSLKYVHPSPASRKRRRRK